MQDFARSESLWLRKYLEAWHVASENGHTSTELTYLDKRRGPRRHQLSKNEAHDCMNPPRQCTKEKLDEGGESYPCHSITAAAEAPDLVFAPDSCMNKNKLVSEQRPGRVGPLDWQWLNVISLKNPTSSPTKKGFTADSVLNRQRLTETWNNKYALHAVDDNEPWPSSCVISPYENAFWEAEFTDGTESIK